ncbi:MAG: hypothetical protein R2932_57310 [Caldilineaceae bacterium]
MFSATVATAAPTPDLCDAPIISLGCDIVDTTVDIITDPVGTVGGLVTKAVGVDSAMNQLSENIQLAGAMAQEVVVVAGDQAQQVVRVAGAEAEAVADRLGSEAQEVILVASDQSQQVIKMAGTEAEQVAAQVGQQAQEVVIVAGNQSQQVIKVAGNEARQTAAAMGKEAREVVMIASSQAQQIVELSGAQAQAVVRLAGEEARQTLEKFRSDNERIVQLISATYKENLNVTINSLDEGSRRVLRNYEQALNQSNQLLLQDALFIETRLNTVVENASEELRGSILQLEQSQKEVILTAVEGGVYLIDRTTNNVIVVLSILLLGFGVLLFIYLFFRHQMPAGIAGPIAYGLIVLYFLVFGTLLLSAVVRMSLMTSAQLGVRAQLTLSTQPEIVFVTPRTLTWGGDNQTIEIIGRNLYLDDTVPQLWINERPVQPAQYTADRIAAIVQSTDFPSETNNLLRVVIDYGNRGPHHTFLLPVANAPQQIIAEIGTLDQAATVRATAPDGANVYFGPGRIYDVVGNIAVEQTAPIVGRNSEQSWWAIAWESGFDGMGWLAAEQVAVAGNLLSVPVLSAVAPTPTPPSVPRLRVIQPANIRSGPGEYSLIGAGAIGDEFDITGKSTGADWYRIDYIDTHGQHYEGWIWDALVLVITDGTVPEVAIPPFRPIQTATPAATAVPTATETPLPTATPVPAAPPPVPVPPTDTPLPPPATFTPEPTVDVAATAKQIAADLLATAAASTATAIAEVEARGIDVVVTFNRIVTHDDGDSGFNGDGEIWLDFNVNGLPRRWPPSGVRDIEDGGSYDINEQIALHLNRSESLAIFVQGTEEDNSPDDDDPMGVVQVQFDGSSNWGSGQHEARSSCPDGCYTIYFTVEVRQP